MGVLKGKLFYEGIPVLGEVSSQDFDRVEGALSKFMVHVLSLKPRDLFYIINRNADNIAYAAYQAALDNKYNVRCFNIKYNKPLPEFPEKLKDFLRKNPSKAMTTFFDYSSYEKGFDRQEQPARIELVAELIPNLPTICVHSPGITWNMAANYNGSLQADYEIVSGRARRIFAGLKGAEKIRVTNDAGTNIMIDVPKNLEWETDCFYERKPDGTFCYGKIGTMGNLPVGEVFGMLPHSSGKVGGIKVEEKIPTKINCNGVFVCDLSSSLTEKKAADSSRYLLFDVRGGVVKKIKCEDREYLSEVKAAYSKMIKGERIVVEEVLGTGINDKARVTGNNFLEDEKADKTNHFAFSTNILNNGKIGNVHGDHLTSKPTYKVTYADGRKEVIMEEGILLI